MIKFNYMLEIDISRNSSPRKLGVLRGAFEGFGCPKRHPDALLAKTMVGTTGQITLLWLGSAMKTISIPKVKGHFTVHRRCILRF